MRVVIEIIFILMATHVLSLQVLDDGGNVQSTLQLDKPHCILGRAADVVDVPLAHEGASREHAALVHHQDGRIYLIDLKSVRGMKLQPNDETELPIRTSSQTRGTLLNGKPVEAHKPVALFHGGTLQFGAAGPVFKLHAPHLGANPCRACASAYRLPRHSTSRGARFAPIGKAP